MIKNFIGAFFIAFIEVFLWNKWSLKKLKWNSVRIWFFIFIISVFILLNYFIGNSLLKFITITIILIIAYKFLFKTKFKYSILSPIFSQTLYFISESIYVSIVFLLFNDNVESFINDYFGSFISNICISLLVFIISMVPFVSKVYYKFLNIIHKINELNFMFFSISILYIYSIFVFNIYYGSNPEILMILSAGISVLAFILVYMYLKIKDDYYKMSDRYNSSLLSLKELEKVLSNYRIDNHENRNHLLTIRNMTRSKKITDFIDTIVNNQLKDDKKIMKETSIIPAGGLRGLVYSKLLLMNNKNIDYELDVANTVRVVDILDYSDETMLDICKIVGIFLDNAIEEVDTIEDKYIVIEMYYNDEIFTISITNTFDNTKDKKEIYKAGVSTKGGNHGYGLSLVKKIVKSNDKLKTHNEITEDEFIQVLEIYK